MNELEYVGIVDCSVDFSTEQFDILKYKRVLIGTILFSHEFSLDLSVMLTSLDTQHISIYQVYIMRQIGQGQAQIHCPNVDYNHMGPHHHMMWAQQHLERIKAVYTIELRLVSIWLIVNCSDSDLSRRDSLILYLTYTLHQTLHCQVKSLLFTFEIYYMRLKAPSRVLLPSLSKSSQTIKHLSSFLSYLNLKTISICYLVQFCT